MALRVVSYQARLTRYGRVLLALALITVCGFVTQASAQLVYVEAVDQLTPASQNIFSNTGGPITDLTHLDPNNSADAQVPGNNIWNYRDEGVPFGGFATIYESVQEDSPELQVRITSGLTAGQNYDVYVAYWSDQADWRVRAGFTSSPGTNPVFNRVGGVDGTAGTFAGNAIWATPPDDNPEATVDNPSPFVNITDLAGTVDPATQNMYLGLVGTTTAAAGGRIDVYIDDFASLTDINVRTWFDGLAFVPTGNPVFVTATVDRDTGSLTFANPTGVPLSIVSYSIASPGGALNQTLWNEIATGQSNVSGTGWTVTSPSGTSVLELAENGMAATIPATTGTLQVGNVFNRTPVEDISMTVNLSNGQSLLVTPTYTGTAITPGDFDADGDINLDDYSILLDGMFNPAATTATLVNAYQMGDITRNNLIDVFDFLAFRNAFDAANGAGSFQAMLASIPEPSTGLLALLGLNVLFCRRGLRRIGRLTGHLSDQSVSSYRLAALVVLVIVCTSNMANSQTTPVTGWFVSNAAPVTNGNTNSPTIGDGTANNADNTTIWAALQDPITLANGQEVVLNGSVQFIGVGPAAGDAFRVGLFNGNNWFDATTNPTYDGVTDEAFNAGTVPAAWGGFLATSASGTNTGSFDAKNANYSAFNTTNFVSTFGGSPNTNLGLQSVLPGTTGIMVPGDPNTNARIIRLAAGAPVRGNMVDGTYDFEIRVGRFGDENTMSVRIASQDTLALAGDFDGDNDVDGRDFLVWQRGGSPTPLSAADLANWQTNYGQSGGGSEPRYLWNLTATASPLIDTSPISLIPSEFDRVGLLLSGSQDADQAIFSDINITRTTIQTLILDVNTNSGAMSIRNSSGNAFDITYYEVTSANGNLDHTPGNPTGWVSFDDGEGGDPEGTGWDEITNATANVIAELNLQDSTLVSDGTSLSLGTAFNTATPPANRDLNFFFTLTDGSLVRGLVNYNTTSSILAVPEPCTLSLLAGVGILVLGLRRAAAC